LPPIFFPGTPIITGEYEQLITMEKKSKNANLKKMIPSFFPPKSTS
jgi:hypothetical protein